MNAINVSATEPALPDKLKIFISYSRRDSAVADTLVDALHVHDFEVAIDRRDLPFGEKWQAELAELISHCDTAIWLISEASVRSEWVRWELNEITKRSKRLIPVMIADTSRDKLPRELYEIHILPAAGLFDFTQDLDTLVQVLETDHAWLKEASRLQDRAAEWRAKGRDPGLLLPRIALAAAGQWKDNRPAKAPPPAPEVLDLILASRHKAAQRQRRLILGSAIAVTLLLAGAVVASNWRVVRARYREYIEMGLEPLSVKYERALRPGQEFRECRRGCPAMIVIPAGQFVMGSSDGKTPIIGLDGRPKSSSPSIAELGRDNTEGPQHEVIIERSFAVSKYEVTFAEWGLCVAAGACRVASDNGRGDGNLPVFNVNWNAAQSYAAWLSSITGKHYRLLTESEWEYAARAGSKDIFSFGDEKANIEDHAWYIKNSDSRPHPVGQKKPNGFGLHDMHGNVGEWCEDDWLDSYADAPNNAAPRREKQGRNLHIVRGVGWLMGLRQLRVSFRFGSVATQQNELIGFRLARTLTQ